MTDDQMNYHGLVEDAMRGVVRRALEKVATDGLPGQHHFYVSFRTRAPGVDIGDRLPAQYPDEMTIVIQHQFSGLDVDRDGFRISLSFGGRLEALIIPFSAIVGFVDPSVSFGLQFGDGPKAAQDAASDEPAQVETPGDNTGGTASIPGGDVVRLDTFRKK